MSRAPRYTEEEYRLLLMKQCFPEELPESELQRECESILKGHGIWFLHMRKAKGNKAGVPDLIFPNPYKDGQFTALELKRKKKYKVDLKQLETIAHISKNEGYASVITDADELRKLLQKDCNADKPRGRVSDSEVETV